MAYRRRQGIGKSATFKEEINHLPPENITIVKDKPPPSRSFTSPSSSSSCESPAFDQPRSKNFTAYGTEAKGLWGVISQKAKYVITEDDKSKDSSKKMDNPKLQRGLDKLTSSLNKIGDTFEKAFEVVLLLPLLDVVLYQIRLQLESLLAEKARLAHENSVYTRENWFLREIVEYHQLTMQDVVYIDEGTEEVTQVFPFVSTWMTPPSTEEETQSPSHEMIKEILVVDDNRIQDSSGYVVLDS